MIETGWQKIERPTMQMPGNNMHPVTDLLARRTRGLDPRLRSSIGLWFGGIALLACLLTSACPAENLRLLTSKHYTIHTDFDPALAQDMARRMDAMYAEFQRRLAEFKAPAAAPERFEVYLFEHKADYDKLTENRFPNTGGIFMAGQRNLLAAFLEDQGRDALRRTLQHEAFHQFAYAQISHELPIWLNEGLAQLFEEGIWTGGQFLIGQAPPQRVRQLQTDLSAGSLIDFQSFLGQSDDAWAARLAGSAEAGGTQYNQAWAMVHFLAYSKPEYRNRLRDMLSKLHDGQNRQTVFEQCFSNNYTGFQARFTDWAKQLQPTSEAMTIESQQVLADMLLAFSKQRQTFDSIQSFKDAVMDSGVRLRYTRGSMTWSTAEDPRVYFCDLAGRSLGLKQLFLDRSGRTGLPDIVRQIDGITLRTRFYEFGGSIQHEMVIESR